MPYYTLSAFFSQSGKVSAVAHCAQEKRGEGGSAYLIFLTGVRSSDPADCSVYFFHHEQKQMFAHGIYIEVNILIS